MRLGHEHPESALVLMRRPGSVLAATHDQYAGRYEYDDRFVWTTALKASLNAVFIRASEAKVLHYDQRIVSATERCFSHPDVSKVVIRWRFAHRGGGGPDFSAEAFGALGDPIGQPAAADTIIGALAALESAGIQDRAPLRGQRKP